MKNRKNNVKTQVIGAVMAVILTAGLGTAALASSEPGGGGPSSGEPSAFAGERPAQQPGAVSEEPGVPQERDTDAAPQRPEADEMGQPSDEPGASGEMGQSSDESGASGEMGQPSDEPGASGEMGQPSDEPGASGEIGQSSDKPGASGEIGQSSDEPGRAEEPAQGGKDVPNDRSGFRQSIDSIIEFFRDLFSRLGELLGITPRGEAPAQESPTFEQGDRQPAEEPGASGEMGQSSGEPGASGEMGQSSGEPTSYSAASTVTEDSAGGTYTSVNGGENAVLVSGKSVTLTDVTVNKTGSSNGESADFYGINAGVLATDGANLTIENATVTTDGSHANGVFSYGSGTVVNISDSTITTSANNSGGIMTTGGASLNASNLTVSTSGNSSAAIRSDRGGGTVNVTEGSYTASGVGSPAVYSTADITVADAVLASTASEAVVIEGGNSVTLTNAVVSGNNATLNGQSTVRTNVLIYQSMSGDAAEGSSTFTMTGGSMTAGTGAMFHVTNVVTEINLSGVEFTYASDSDVFLDASADAWGTAGRNGGSVTLNLDEQDITGVITTDSVSSVTVNMTNGSTWTLTGDSYITSLTGDVSGLDLNGCTLYVNGVAYAA